MKLLLAIDGSSYSREALRAVADSKPAPDTEIRVISVVDFFEPLPSLEGIKQKEIAAARNLVAEKVKELQATFPHIKVSGDVCNGYADGQIINDAKTWSADLIVMGSHGRTAIQRFLMGSISRAVLHNSPCSVRIVRSPSKKNVDAEKNKNNVLVALDPSEHSKFALENVLKSPWPDGTKFKVMTVIPQPKDQMFLDPHFADEKKQEAELLEKLREQAVIWLGTAVDQLTKSFGAGCASSEIFEGDPREKILDAAEIWPAGLIVVGSHGLKPIERVFLGSVSEAIVFHAHCSVEVTRAPGTVHGKPTLIF